MIFKNFQQTSIHTSYYSCIIVEWGVASETSTHATVTLCCSFLPAASGSSGLGFGKFNMKKKVFATAKGSVFVTPWDQMQNHMQSHYHCLSATFQPICISHTYTCTHTLHVTLPHVLLNTHTTYIYMHTHNTYVCIHTLHSHVGEENYSRVVRLFVFPREPSPFQRASARKVC